MRTKSKPRKTRTAREQAATYRVARPSLTRAEQRALAEFRARLHKILPNGELKSLILFGSKARGETHPGSDVDLYLIHGDLSKEQEKIIDNLTSDLLGEKPELHVLTYSADRHAAQAKAGWPLLVNIAREGKLIE